MRTSSMRLTLVDEVIPGTGLLRDVLLVLGFSLVTALSAQFSLWIGPVPLTGQTFAVLLSGALLGSRRGALAQLTYIAVGASGLPYWFAPGGPLGIARLAGPTGGYLFGFVAAAFVVGWFAERGWDRGLWRSGLAMVSGSAAMYALALPWLANFVPAGRVLELGLYPFVAGDLVKIVLATMCLPVGWRLVKQFKR